MKFRFLLFLSIFSSFCLTISAQNKTDERVSIEGKTFILHEVQNEETIFTLCKLYNIEQKELVAANPDLLFGLKQGNTVKIPALQEPKLIEYKVKRKQTVFSVSRQYQITLDELYRYNPSARNGIEVGQVLRIPVSEINKNEISKTTEVISEDKKEYPSPAESRPNPEPYIYHRIETGETIFDLEKQYGLSLDSLLANNPVLKKGILPGTVIRIPFGQLPVIHTEPVNENEFIRYTVKAGETMYDVASQFYLTVSELKNFNPELEYREMRTSEELLIPDKSRMEKVYDATIMDSIWVSPAFKVTPSSQGNPESSGADTQNHDKTYQVALMLPLFLDANDTINRIPLSSKELLADSLFLSTYKRGTVLPKDTFKIRQDLIIDPRSENFMHLYEGVLLAADSLRKQGMNLELYVFDTNRDSLVVESFIQQDIFREMDLIIGPVFPQVQGSVSAFSAKNQIPMVSPLSSAGNFENNNPYYFKINPNKEYLIRETAKWIADDCFNKNFIVFQMGDYKILPEADLVNQCRERLFSTGYYDHCKDVLYHEYNFETEGIWGMQRIVSPDRENVVIIPAINEGQISIAFTNLNTVAEQFNIRLVGLSGFKNYRSIQPEYFHQTQLQYLTHYFIDYENLQVNQFIATFKKQFATEPNEFSFQGFDLAYYFMSALYTYEKDMIHYIPNFRMNLNQLNLNFQRVSKTGGYMNYGLIKVGYKKDFSISNDGYYSPNSLLPVKIPSE